MWLTNILCVTKHWKELIHTFYYRLAKLLYGKQQKLLQGEQRKLLQGEQRKAHKPYKKNLCANNYDIKKTNFSVSRCRGMCFIAFIRHCCLHAGLSGHLERELRQAV